MCTGTHCLFVLCSHIWLSGCQQTTALYDRLVAKGALMGQTFGLENALWFADGPEDAHETPTFERNRSHDYVARECEAV